MTRKALLLTGFVLVLSVETVYFARAFGAGLLRVGAERAFFRNDHPAAWNLYNRALSWGGDLDLLETDLVELILFGLDQHEAGIKIDLLLPAESSLQLAHEMIARRIHDAPYKAYVWSLASDIYAHEARRRRRATVLNLSNLSEDPFENLLPEERRSLGALEMAGRLESLNYIYQDLLVEMYLGIRDIQAAAAHTRKAMHDNPDPDDHPYLKRSDLPRQVLDAAFLGLEDAANEAYMVSRLEILYLAGTLANRHGEQASAEGYFRKVLEVAPDHYGALIEQGHVLRRRKDYRGAVDMFRRASQVMENMPTSYYFAGISLEALGDAEGAIDFLRKAREVGPEDESVFHALGRALEAAGRIEEAERQFVAAANLFPHRAQAWVALLEFQLRHEDTRGARDVCARLARLGLDADLIQRRCASLSSELP